MGGEGLLFLFFAEARKREKEREGDRKKMKDLPMGGEGGREGGRE